MFQFLLHGFKSQLYSWRSLEPAYEATRAIYIRTFSTSSLTTEALQLDEKHDWALQVVQLTRRQHLRLNDPETEATSITSSSRPNIISCYRVFKFQNSRFCTNQL